MNPASGRCPTASQKCGRFAGGKCFALVERREAGGVHDAPPTACTRNRCMAFSRSAIENKQTFRHGLQDGMIPRAVQSRRVRGVTDKNCAACAGRRNPRICSLFMRAFLSAFVPMRARSHMCRGRLLPLLSLLFQNTYLARVTRFLIFSITCSISD